MGLFCACSKCYACWTPTEVRQARTFVFNALYVNPHLLLEVEPSDTVVAATSVAVAVYGAHDGVILRNKYHDFYARLIGHPIDSEQDMLDATHTLLRTLERIAPHKVVVNGGRVNEDELRTFRGRQGTWRSGRAAAFYSYSIGTILYFSDQTEAVMAKVVLDSPDRHRLHI